METNTEAKIKKEVAERVREVCIQAAREGFLDASMGGLCTEGAAEAAISAMQKLDFNDILEGISSNNS